MHFRLCISGDIVFMTFFVCYCFQLKTEKPFKIFNNSLTNSLKMSADLYWMVTRDTSSFMMKGRLSKGKIFTREPMNLTGLHSLTSSGTVGPKAIGITAAPDNKGVVVVTKKPKAVSKPGQSTTSVTHKKGRRAVIKSVANSVSAFNKTKKRAAMKRTSAILRSQRPRIGKRTKKD